MEVDTDLSDKLNTISSQPNQKDRTTSYLALLSSLLSPPVSVDSLTAFGRHFTTSTSTASIVGRRVLGAFVQALLAGSGCEVALPSSSGAGAEEGSEGDDEWEKKGREAFDGERGEEARREVVEKVLEGGTQGWCDDQTTVLRHLHSHVLQQEEDWMGAARALMQIPLEGGSRVISDEEKLAVYIKIVRLLLECGESPLAQTYFNRASLLIHTTKDKPTLLMYRLSQARLFDFSARFNEAAQRYHELSFDAAIDEGERLQMLKAAVTTSILAPSGPLRSRLLSSLNRDDRIHNSLPGYLSTMLTKMLLEYIVRPEEVREFEEGLEEHQRARVEVGGGAEGTVLERAVREHNVGACGKVYDNISFEALGAVLGLDADSSEIVARRMIEQGRLRAWIDQPLHLLHFESRAPHDSDADAQGTAGGLGVEREEKEVEPVSWTERWDDRIRSTSVKVESLAALIQARGLLPASGAVVS